jgi:hypothetical protein
VDTDTVCSQNHTCTKCGKTGHFEICCKTKPANAKHSKQNSRPDPPKKPPYRVNAVAPEDQAPPDNAVPDDDGYYAFTAADNPQSPSTLPILIENKVIDVVVDSGASCNLISHEVFQFVLGGGG